MVLIANLQIFFFFKKPIPRDEESAAGGSNKTALYHIDNGRIDMVTNILGTVFSCLAPLLSIVVLSFVSDPRTRLGLVCLFTLLFCLSLAVATKTRRIEIFASTAA